MRITGGTLGGRTLRVVGSTRPTQDKVRQAIFSALAAKVPGARVLDLFAGAGSLGLEAWSRGAEEVWWVESHAATCHHLQKTVAELCGPAAQGAVVRRADALRFLETPPVGHPGFDLILADPPYDRAGQYRWLEKTLRALESGSMLAANGVLVFEMGSEEKPPATGSWKTVWDRTYGDSRVVMLVRAGESSQEHS